MFKKVTIALSFLLLSACGDSSNGGGTTTSTTIINTGEEELSVGGYVSTDRMATSGWAVKTAKCIFSTYTSVRVAPGTPVTIRQVKGKDNKFTSGRYAYVEGFTEPFPAYIVIIADNLP